MKYIITIASFLYLFSGPLLSAEYITPTMFGANGSDKNDDTDAIQKCVNAAKKDKSKKIVFEPGTYFLKGTIDLTGVNELIIDGNGSRLIKPNGNDSNIIFGEYCKSITIVDFSFEGNRPEKLDSKWPHQMNACAILRKSGNIHFERCLVSNFWYGVCFGTSSINGQDIWVEDCTFENCNSDIDLYGKPAIVISGNVSRGCTGHSIQLEPAYEKDNSIYDYLEQPNIDALSVGNSIVNNTIVDCKGISINIFSGCEDIIISSNHIINYGLIGIACAHKGASNIVISNNVISNSKYDKNKDRPWGTSGAGIAIAAVDNVVISSNVIRHANSGIYVGSTSGASIVNNIISDSKDSGICLYNAEKCLVSGNNVNNYNISHSWWANSGIVIVKSKDLLISDCIINTKTRSPYSIYTDGSSSLTIRDNEGYGYANSLTYPTSLCK